LLSFACARVSFDPGVVVKILKAFHRRDAKKRREKLKHKMILLNAGEA